MVRLTHHYRKSYNMPAMSADLERFAPWAEKLLAISDPAERTAYIEVINHRTNEGCVVRSLEVAFGVKATDEEWDMRIRDQQALREEFKLLDSISEPSLQV